jgi:hypothetical protein
MLQTDYSLVTYTMEQKIEASLREAESERTLAEAGIAPGPGIICRVRRWLYRLGQMLASLGQRLEHSNASWGSSH